MIVRRICHRRAWSSTPREIYPYSTAQSPTPSPLTSHKLPFIGYPNNSINIKIECRKVGLCLFSSQASVDVGTSAGIVDVPLAQTGEGIAECELLKWFVKEGDQVEEFQPLCEVQSDKATIEITSRYKGKVAQFLYVPGDIVKVGESLLKMVVQGAQVPTQKQDVSENFVSHYSEVNKCKTGGVLSTPAVRHLGKQYDINLNDVRGAGKDGRVLKEDILRHALLKGIIKDSIGIENADSRDQFLKGEEDHSYVPAELGSQHGDKAVPLRGFQRAMVKTMSMAAKVPHFHYVEEINCDALVELKESFQTVTLNQV
uniref:Dihydrolipoamide acetyltransferase component of pyruvate dehydrogenase complex n=1 Tax=Populus trichocarpa TaxID=3694 RepID=A0A3N7FG38_POPTR